MSDEHVDDLLRELRDDLMAVRPSPEFAAKVRRQVEAQSARRWFGIWQVATAASVVALAAVALVLWQAETPVTNPPAQATTAVEQPVPSAAPPTSVPPATTQTTAAPPAASGQIAAVANRPQQLKSSEPEVLVPASERMALIALLEGLQRRGNQVPPETTLLVDDEGRLPAPAEIKVAPITIEPLGPPVPGGGSRERQ